MKTRLQLPALLAVITLLAFCMPPLAAQDRSEWFEFCLPWDDSTSTVTDMSGYLDPPAGKHGFLEVTPEGQFRFAESGERVKFVGVNNVATANFPGKDEAGILAARMAKYGINLVRIHLVDVDWDNGLFANSAVNTTQLSADRLDRMDYLIKCMKERGIYFNFCIQSGRLFKEGDQIDAPILNDQSKYSTLFNQRLIELQEDFAGKVLAHTNPYTGLSYVDEPAMVSVELTNENSLFNGWFGWQSDHIFGDTQDGIGPCYSAQLDSLFNSWLEDKYENDSSLRAAWAGSGGAGSELILNPSFEDGFQHWSHYVNTGDGAAATFEIDPDTVRHGSRSVRITSTSAGTQGWHIHLKTNEFSVAEGESYRIRFYAKSDFVTPAQIEIMENETWYWYGAPGYTPGPEWKAFEFYFTCTKTTSRQIIQFEYGTQTGTFWLDSVSVTRYDGNGLEEGESLAMNNVNRVRSTEIGKYTPRRIGDNAEFYFDIEGAYMDQLTGYLKNDLGIRCPVTFTNNYYGLASIYSQSRAGYMDTHYYWDHPSFPHGWSDTDFTLNNRSMLLDPAGSTLNRMPLCRVDGLPLVLSEYNHPYPYIFQSEAPSLVYAYGSFMDLDGIIWHAYYDYHDRYQQREQDMFFDIAMHPVMMTQLLLSVPYRLGYIEPAGETVVARYTEQEVFDNTKFFQDTEVLNMAQSNYGTSFLNQGFSHGSFSADSTCLEGELAMTGTDVISGTGELAWHGGEGCFTVNNPYWQGATGYLKGKTVELGDIILSDISTTEGLDFGAVHLVSLDSLPIAGSKRMVLLTSARLENEGFLWNETKTSPVSVGGTRALCEPVSGRLTFKASLHDSARVFRLDERGARTHLLELVRDGSSASVDFGDQTLWYEILNDTGTVEIPVPVVHGKPALQYLQHFPNPCNDFVSVEFSHPESFRADLFLFNTMGQIIRSRELYVEGGLACSTLLDLSDLPAGVYLCGVMRDNGQRYLDRIVVCK
jgi:hypothetical protein